MDIIEKLFNKVVDAIKAFLTGKLGALVVLAVAAVAFVFAFLGTIAYIGFALGLVALAAAIFLRSSGVKTPFTSLAATLGAVAVVLGAIVFGSATTLDNTASAEYAKGRWYTEGNDSYEQFQVQYAELNGKIKEYNGDNKLKDSLKKKVDKKVEKINKKYNKNKKSSSSDYDW